MKKSIFAIAIVALFIGAAALSTGVTNSDIDLTPLEKTHLRAKININDRLEWESKFHIGWYHFGVKITGTLENRTYIRPFPYLGWLFDLSYEIEPGATIEITTPFLNVKKFTDMDGIYWIDFVAYNVKIKLIE